MSEAVCGGAVELREDVPLKGAGGGGWRGRCAGGSGGPRTIATCFGALSVGITVALVAQIYSGDYEVVPHGSVATGAAACSRAGTDQLKAGGRALDAAVAAALCLAVVAPHATSLDASGSLLYWEYRQQRSTEPTAVEWGGGAAPRPAGTRPPRLVAALAALHATLGVLPWSKLLQPAIDQARLGFPVSEGLALALDSAAQGGAHSPEVGSLTTAPQIADYLESLQRNSSAELTASWDGSSLLRSYSVPAQSAGSWRVYTAGPGARATVRALGAAFDPPPASIDDATTRVIEALVQEAKGPPAAGEAAWPPAQGAAAGLAIVDPLDTYLALVTGLSTAFGSGPATAAGWTRDEPTAALDLAPLIMVDGRVCGTRYVLGGESSGAVAQAGAAVGAGGGAGGVERARVVVGASGVLAAERARPGPGPALWPGLGPVTVNASQPYAAVNLVQQTADALASHADSRSGGVASRF